MSSHRCKIGNCDWAADADLPLHISGCFAAWHIYEDHPDVWRRVIGNRPPIDPDPRTEDGLALAIVQSQERGELSQQHIAHLN
jgi:hypothetical protein